MNFLPKKKRHFALAGDGRLSVLAEVLRTSTGIPTHRILAMTEGVVSDEAVLARLLTSAGEMKGRISIALPLSHFETLSMPLPLMPETSIGRALPYHLGKALSRPLKEYVYDWQITQRRKEQLEVGVFLYPEKLFQQMRKQLAEKELEVTNMEPDVFAAFAYLGRDGRLSPRETTLCCLLWPETISLAVYENGILALVRTVPTSQPTTPFGVVEEEEESVPAEEVGEEAKAEPTEESRGLLADTEVDSILDGFDLGGGGGGDGGDDAGLSLEAVELGGAGDSISLEMPSDDLLGEAPLAAPAANSMIWPDYIESVTLDIMRTRDYYVSVVKGEAVKNIVVNGAEDFKEELQEAINGSLRMESSSLARAALGADCPTSLIAISIGTGMRW